MFLTPKSLLRKALPASALMSAVILPIAHAAFSRAATLASTVRSVINSLGLTRSCTAYPSHRGPIEKLSSLYLQHCPSRG